MKKKLIVFLVLSLFFVFNGVKVLNVLAEESTTAHTEQAKSSEQSENTDKTNQTTEAPSTETSEVTQTTPSVSEETNKELGSQRSTEEGFYPFVEGKRSDLSETNQIQSRAFGINAFSIGAGETIRPAKDFIDVSSHNGNISVANYLTMKSYGVKGVIVKLTEYTTYQNPYAAQQIANAKAAGLKVGVYHYSWFTTTSGARAEANYFAAMAKQLGLSADTLMVNDAEQADMKAGNVTANSLAFADQLAAQGYGHVMHYSMLSWFTSGVMSPTTLGYKNIWVAQYPYEPLASNLLNREYGAWQWSSELTFPGIAGNFDINIDYNDIFNANVVYDKIYYNNVVDFTAKLKDANSTMGYGIYDDIYNTRPNINEIGKGSLYANQEAKILRVAKTDKATWFQFSINGKLIGWINSDAFDLSSGKVYYSAYVAGNGWQYQASDGQSAGTTGNNKNIESLQMNVNNLALGASGKIEYRAHIQSSGWQSQYSSNGNIVGIAGSGKRIEALQVRLTGELAEKYDIYYRTHVSKLGWLGWAKNDEYAGTTKYGYAMEDFQVMILPKGTQAPGTTDNSYKEKEMDVSYQAYVQPGVWQSEVSSLEDTFSGTTDQGKQIQGIKMNLRTQAYTGDITYQLYTQTYGWLDPVKNNEVSGKPTEGKRAEALRINLTGEMAKNYDIYYRVYAQKFGWLDWAKNGESAGTSGYGYRMEGYQVKLVLKGTAAPGPTDNKYKGQPIDIFYQSYIQPGVWQTGVSTEKDEISGTTGEAKQIEAIKMNLREQTYTGDITYQLHVQTYGWLNPVKNNEISGKPTEGKRAEALRINLTGDMAKNYDIYYRVHSQTFGWLDWAKNGESAGTSGYGYRMEAYQVKLVPKGSTAPGPTGTSYKGQPMDILYQSYVQPGLWQSGVSTEKDEISGTIGESKQIEGVKLNLREQKYAGDITYQLYVQTYGWLDAVKNNQESGKIGEGKRGEALRINLTDDMAKNYDIYYRVHSQQFGWLDWAKNGEAAGTSGYAYRMEAYQVKIVPKGAAAPGKTAKPFQAKE